MFSRGPGGSGKAGGHSGSWLGLQAWQSQQTGMDVSEALSLEDLGMIFQSVEKYCKKNLQVGLGPGLGRGQGGERCPPNASLLG